MSSNSCSGEYSISLHKEKCGEHSAEKEDNITLLWIQGQGCSGCTISFIQTNFPDVVDIIGGTIPPFKVTIGHHPTIMVSWGEKAIEILENPPEQFVLVVEGSVPTENNGLFCIIGEKDGNPIAFGEWLKKLAPKAAAVVAVGTCACFGGIPGGSPNPTGAKGVMDFLGKDFKSSLGLPVINIPGCPPHPDWITGTLVNLIMTVKAGFPSIELDELNRPVEFFGRTVHETCPRAGFFTEGEFAEKFGDRGCLLLLGCKGPVSRGDCPERKWNGGVNACPISGGVCIGCTDPEFPDIMSPFVYYPPKPIPEFIPPSTLLMLLYGVDIKEELEKWLKRR